MKSGLTSAQVELLRRLIISDRWYRSSEAAGDHLHPDVRGLEVNWLINGIKPATAAALVDAGLAETIALTPTQTWIYLGKYNMYDPVEPH